MVGDDVGRSAYAIILDISKHFPPPMARGDDGEGKIKSFHPHPSLSHQGRGVVGLVVGLLVIFPFPLAGGRFIGL
jgi:hypothetical protein